jgi:hypothetical protein
MTSKLLDTKQISAIRSYIKAKAKSLAPNHIAPHIGATVKARADGWSVKWIVNIREAPDAAAQEYGSGEKVPGGKKYIIAPKKPNGVLAFRWDTANKDALRGNLNRRIGEARKLGGLGIDFARRDGSKFYGFLSDGRLMFNYVEHPGIEKYKGVGYLGEALRQSMEEVSEMVLKGAKDGLAKEVYKPFRFRRHT